MTIVVDEIDNIAPRKILSMLLQPKAWPSEYPAQSMTRIARVAPMKAVAPTCFSFRRLNSRPSENMRKMMPSSESVWIVSSLAMRGNGGVWGPMITPAKM